MSIDVPAWVDGTAPYRNAANLNKLSNGITGLDTRVSALETATAAAVAPVAFLRGVNMSGAEFAAAAATLPGTYSTDYAYDGSTALASIAGYGHKVVRLPIRWERIQPTRNAALDSTELGRITTYLANAHAAGLSVIVDVHNYARFINSVANGGATLVLADTLPVDDLVDLWTRLSSALNGTDGLYAYGLMNEPHDLVPVAGAFTGTTRYDWNAGTVAGWTGDSATASNVSNKLRLSASLGSGSVNMRKDDAGTVAGGSGPTGSVIRFEATLVTNPGGTWTAKAQWQNSGFSWQDPTSVAYTRVSNGATETGLVSGAAVYVTCTFASITSPPNAFCIQIDGTGATAGTVTVDVDNFAQGGTSGGTTEAQVWENASQDVVDGIRGNDDTTPILVGGYGYSGAHNFPTNHPTPWIDDPADATIYEAHYYFDADNSGDYPDDYATENAAAVTAGHPSLAARAAAELARFTGWLDTFGVRGFVGEIGWPNDGDTDGWNAVGETLYRLLDDHRVGATYWAGGARWGTSYNLSIYTGTNQDTAEAPAAVVEAHPSPAVDTPGLDARIGALEAGAGPGAAVPHTGPAFMVIGATTPTELATAALHGATHGLVEAIWDQCQSSSGGAVDASGVQEDIAAVLAAGLKVCLRVSPQYTPSFASSATKFKRSGGTEWSDTGASGNNVRDWVWAADARGLLADFLDKLFAQLDWSLIERVQVGGLVAGELSYPPQDNATPAPYWWGFSTPAQTGTGLAAGQAVCPVPSHTPSSGTTWTDDDETFVVWYQQSLINFMRWLIGKHRRWFTGPIWVLHPGAGLRKVSQTPTGGQAMNYRLNAAAGLDWEWQVGAYPDSNVHPYSTWVDSDHFWAAAPYTESADGNAAPWYHLLRVARAAGRADRMWGENTGGQTNTDMDRIFQEGAITFGFEGIGWLSHTSLSSGTDDTYANWAARIADLVG